MRVFHDQDASLEPLAGRLIAVIGYGNQGRSQALNLRDTGLPVIVGNRDDASATVARDDGMEVVPIADAATRASVIMLLLPDEVAADVFRAEVHSGLSEDDVLVFASGYNVAFGHIELPSEIDAVLLAPRMIGAGVRELYLDGAGFPSFVGVEQDHSGSARAIVLALAKGIGSTRRGVVEVSFAQEAELDLFTEQCFGPAFGHALTSSVDLLLEEGYPPEAVLLELYMSGEFAYTLHKIAELGMIEQMALHSNTSQYGSMSRGMRFMSSELRGKLRRGLDEIRSGAFAREWAAEREAGSPTLSALRAAALSLPLSAMERELRSALGATGTAFRPRVGAIGRSGDSSDGKELGTEDIVSQPTRALGGRVRGWFSRRGPGAVATADEMNAAKLDKALHLFCGLVAADRSLTTFAQGRSLSTHYVLSDSDQEFHMVFHNGVVTSGSGPPPGPAHVRIETDSATLDGMFTGRVNPMRAAMSGMLQFSGEAKLAMSIQQVQADLSRIYQEARREALL